MGAHSPRATSIQDSFHDFEQKLSFLSVVRLRTASSDPRPSDTNATRNLGVEVRALADSTTMVHKTVRPTALICSAFDTVLESDHRCMATVFFSETVSPNFWHATTITFTVLASPRGDVGTNLASSAFSIPHTAR